LLVLPFVGAGCSSTREAPEAGVVHAEDLLPVVTAP